MYKLNVKNLLDATGKTQYWLSKQTGISANNIGKIYNGETVNIRLDTINKLCHALDCTPGDLFTDGNEKSEPINPVIFYANKNDTNK